MKTSELIAALADSGPVKPAAPARRILLAALVGAALALGVLAMWLGFQPLALAARASWFWMKAGYSLALALAGLLLLDRLSRPGARLGAAGLVVGAVAFAVIAGLAAHAAMSTPADEWRALWLGESAKVCSVRILLLAVPVFLTIAMGLRQLAPTRLRLAGAAAGLLAGGLSAVVYGLYCQEHTAPFVASWYSLGMAGCALIGGLVGPRLLRW